MRRDWSDTAVGTLETDLPGLPSRKGAHTEDKLLDMGTNGAKQIEEREGLGKNGRPGNVPR